ncbi:MAG: right-handed parallel beta-helix repeat-containing protein [Phycisphaerales bacterium]
MRHLQPAGLLLRAIALFAALALPAVSAADVIFVRRSATGANTGASWTDAYTDLQDALLAARIGDEIWVAAGTYSPAPQPPAPDQANRDASFLMRSGVALFGGFAGDESARDQRDPEANTTILSGDLMQDDGDDFANSADNSFHVVVAISVDSTGILDGFTVRSGHADGAGMGAVPESKEQGAGLNIYYGGPVVRNCVFEFNWCGNHGSLNDHGDTTRVENCVFRDNFSVGFGAGLYIHNHSQTFVSDCMFLRNVASAEGGGMYSRSMAGAFIQNCLFSENLAVLGAGFYNAEGSSAHIHDSTFFGNFASIGGAGIYTDRTAVVISNCIFAENTAGIDDAGGGAGSGGSGGGGIWNTGGAPLIRNCIFSGNAASFGGGVYNIDLSQASIEDCFFTHNFAREAGGVYALSSPIAIRRCTFVGNRAESGVFAVGGAVSNYFSDDSISDCVFTGNTATLGGGAIYNEGAAPVIQRCVIRFNAAIGQEGAYGWGGAIFNGYSTLATIANCDIFHNSALVGGAVFNLIFSAPAFSNCTILQNTATGQFADFAGGGVYTYFGSDPLLRNCIIFSNAPDSIAGPGVPDVAYSCIQGDHPGVGNTPVPPSLLRLPSPGVDGVWNTPDDDPGDLTPSPNSVCIDAADNAAPLIGTADAAGAPRRHDDPGMPDRGDGAAPLVDIGAYEFQGASCRGDFNASGSINSQDFFDFLAALFAADPAADVNFDRFVNSQDFFDFLAAFFANC